MAKEKEEPEVVEEIITNTTTEEVPEEERKAPAAATSMADRLIALTKKTNDQLAEMKNMKARIKPAVVNEPIKTTKGIVSFVSGSSSKFLDRNLVRQVLMERLNISSERADQIIDAGSTEKVIASYVKVTPA